MGKNTKQHICKSKNLNMTIKWQLAKAKKTTVLLTRLKEMAMAEDKIN